MKLEYKAVFVLLLTAAAAIAADAPSLDPKQAYVKKETWAQTMVWTRQNCQAWVNAAKPKDGQLADTAIPAVWAKLRVDWPVQSAWFMQDLPHNRHLDWFIHATDLGFESWITRSLSDYGAAGMMLQDQFAELRRMRVSPNDARWLEVYSCSKCLDPLLKVASSLWLDDLRDALMNEAARLIAAKTPANDRAWAALARRAAQCADPTHIAHAGSVTGLQTAIETLAKALPGGINQPELLLNKLAQSRAQWQETIRVLLEPQTSSFDRSASLYQDVRAFRQSLLLSMRGMGKFLSSPANKDLPDEWERQFLSLQHDLANRARIAARAAETFRNDSLILDSDRDPADIVLRRASALLADLKQRSPSADFGTMEKELGDLRAAAGAIDVKSADARYAIYADVCRVRRQIAFRNPLLDFNQLLFIKRNRDIYNHMCDQYYGITARPGGGVFVLSNPFGPRQEVRDVLANSVVERGRLKGQKLWGGPNRTWNLSYDGVGTLSGEETQGGAFLSPNLSYDAKQILFAYVECQGDRSHRTHTDPNRGHWAEGRCYHVFKCNVDGSGLEQLTDGTWNDFDPCWMPSGRVVFTSERRGGYLRCGRVCPTFTIFDMANDGNGIRCLSYHETNEWHPSVTHDGMIVYTRWDYVDRNSMVAHHPWTMTPDGRDPRAVQGNFTSRHSRPDMELSVRAIPNSGRFVATAAPHHGHAYGSLIVIDPLLPDAEVNSPVKRLTPDVGFPESQGGTETYGEPWPLSEDYHLCVYDAATEVPALGLKGNYGLYLVDSFGNKELIYRDAQIGCHNPIPLRPRPVPPVVSAAPVVAAATQPAEATVGVVNVYHTEQPWPAGAKIRALRILQVLPMSVASGPAPHNMGVQIPGTLSVNIGRAVVGTVPVESDGSAYFTAPAHRELFFQALDENGLAITSMRSATQFQAGENAQCQGCHEPRHGTPLAQSVPMAMQRAPSRIAPDVDGTRPFSYARLVQPVLDQHCVACHKENASKAPRLDAEPMLYDLRGYMNHPTMYYASYISLAPKFGFVDYGDGLRTIPGRFGARVAPLYQMLVKGHHDVKLSPEEMHRITVWLDCCSAFYGVYEKEGGEAQLRGEVINPTLE